MKIFITGGTGFIGQVLCQTLLAQGHSLTLLTHHARPSLRGVEFCHSLATYPNFNGFDAIINLAGEPIFHKRWTVKQKAKLQHSRFHLTQQLVDKIQQSDIPPHTFLSGSATGIYGNIDFSENGDEQTPCSTSFTGQLCQQWEALAQQAQSEKTRVCLLRTGIVIDKQGGALKQMLPLYRLGLGGKIASGHQHWAWISLDDEVNAICFLLTHSHCQGAYNLVAPQRLTNAEFNQQLAKKLNRPAFINVPKWVIKLALGERSQILLDNQPLAPARLLADGFVFQDTQFTF